MNLKVYAKKLGFIGELTLEQEFNLSEIKSYFKEVHTALDQLEANCGARLELEKIELETKEYRLILIPQWVNRRPATMVV